jgi:hypothetical protein
VKYTVIKVTYACSKGDVVYELAHRSQAQAGAMITDQFAITLTSGKPPGGFAEALTSLVRSNEDDFEWYWPGDNSPQ